MSDDAKTQVIDAPPRDTQMNVPPNAPKPPQDGGPGWAPVIILAVVALLAIVGGAWALAARNSAKDDLADARKELADATDESAAASGQAADDVKELTAKNAKLTAQLKKARADLAAANKKAASAEAAGASDDSLIAAAKAEVTGMLDASASGCANYSIIGHSDAGEYAVVRADWNGSGCSSNYETIEFLFRQQGSSWTRVPLTAHPVNEPDLDTGAICNQVISGVSTTVKDRITEACH